jgi:alkanesulfonate monooxygenase SsuD/methylene tetrahydromethanopterin reductase-like flavin-dependent oxidoreductase (luciferase family)
MRGAFLAATTEEAEAIAGPAITHLFRETYGKNSAKGARALTNDKGELIVDEDTVGFDSFKNRYLIGTPEDVMPKIHELQDRLGMTELSCWMQLPGLTDQQVLSSARLFAKEVIPAFA